MLQYLIILLDDTSTSYCHYTNVKKERRLIDLEILRAGVLFAMKENLSIQFIYPDYELPEEYQKTIESIDHTKISPVQVDNDADVYIVEGCRELYDIDFHQDRTYVLRTSKVDLFENYKYVVNILGKVFRLNIVITDIETFSDRDFTEYESKLQLFSDEIEQYFLEGKSPQLNVLTDRIMLNQMNNCGAGESCITLAPDGKFYVCPAFYQDIQMGDIGELAIGMIIKNQQLYRLDHAPLCRTCDAFQCRRCIWLNWKTTLEVNTPSHEQCVVAHLERNASRALLNKIRKYKTFLPIQEKIEEISYLDPFDVKEQW